MMSFELGGNVNNNQLKDDQTPLGRTNSCLGNFVIVIDLECERERLLDLLLD